MRKMKLPKPLKIIKSQGSITIYRTDGKRMNDSEMKIASNYIRKNILMKLP